MYLELKAHTVPNGANQNSVSAVTRDLEDHRDSPVICPEMGQVHAGRSAGLIHAMNSPSCVCVCAGVRIQMC